MLRSVSAVYDADGVGWLRDAVCVFCMLYVAILEFQFKIMSTKYFSSCKLI